MKRLTILAIALLTSAATAYSQSWVDITNDFVKNPDFSNNTDGWDVGFDGSSASNYGYQGANYSNYDSETGTNVYISQFAEAWRNQGNWWGEQTLGDASIEQHLYNLPIGKIRLEADIIANDQNRGNNPVSGVYLFIESGGRESTTPVATDNGKPKHFSVELEIPESETTIGIRTESTTANWIVIDNIHLYWYGTEVRPTKITLNQTSATLIQGDKLQLTTTFTPANTTFKGVKFSSSNERVATVDENGLVMAYRTGMSTITAMSDHYEDISTYCLITVEANDVAPTAVIINEIQAANVDMFIDPSFNFGGWVELYNSTDNDVTLNGLYISDNANNLQKMPLNSARHGIVPAHGFCTLWFDHLSRWAPDMMSFKLDTDGGSLFLSNEKGEILQQLDYAPAISRTSYARTTDGGSTWQYTDQPTPGATNATSTYSWTRLEAPQVNRAGGFFDQSFTAIVTIPQGATLRYTTDGSTPTLTNGQTSRNGRISISNTTVLRLRFFQDGKLSSPVTTYSYIYKDKDYYLPVISLVSDNANLYGDDYGIFARGNGNGRPGNGQSSACNWNMDWERPANIEYFDETGDAVFSQEVDIEASGGWSRAWEPHSFNIKASKVYEGNNRMSYQFFEKKPFLRHKALKVRNGGNDNGNRIKDAAIQQVVTTSGLYVETQSYKPVHIFHNGRYIGVENLREPNNKNYGLANYGIDTDDDEMDQWKMSPDSGYVQQVGTMDVFNEWYSLAQTSYDALSYERIKQIVDIEEYINYMAVQLYIAGTDWPKNNIKSFRERSEGQSNSRFRFIIFDTDGAFATSNSFNWFNDAQTWTYDVLYGVSDLYPEGRITKEIEFVTIFKNMLQNETFKKQFADQFCIVAGSVFEPNRARDIINAMATYVNPAMSLEGGSASSSANGVISNLSSSRQTSSVNNMRNYLGLGTPKNVTLSANISEASLLVNNLEVPTRQFSGMLFMPATVKTAAPAGYRFVGWRSDQQTLGTTLFDKGSEWNYYDQGSLDGKNWKSTTYSANWPSGNTPMGYDTGNAQKAAAYNTTLDYGGDSRNKYPTYYFRKNVQLSAAPKTGESFVLDWIADDGFVIYVNGTEAGRYLMNNTPSPTFSDFADTYANANPESGKMTLDASLFKRGKNVIAVELHNNSASSTDVYWDAELIYNQQTSDNYISEDLAYNIPASVESITLTAVFEPLSTTSDEAWDAHPVKINEVSATNDIFVSDLFKKSDWIELYNTTDEDIDIEGMYLSDHLDQPERYQITAGDTQASTIIPAHGHLVIWADNGEGINQLHADFKLNNDANNLVLITAADGSWADTLVYAAHDGYHTVGLYPDGSSDVYIMERPTIGSTNVITTGAEAWTEPEIRVPVAISSQSADDDMALLFDGTSISLQGADVARLDVYTTSGQLVLTTRLHSSAPVNVLSLPRGIYVAHAKSGDDETSLKFTIK